MADRKEVMSWLEELSDIDWLPYHSDSEIRNIAKAALELLKEQGESIPISWLEEKLTGHPELPYAITDGIINVLDLWEER